MKNSKWYITPAAALSIFAMASVLLIGCDSNGTVTPPESPFVKASDWVGGVNWDNRTVINVSMVENGNVLSFSPNNLTFEAGKPYVLRITNPPGNSEKHYFSPDQAKDFFKSIATRKVQTADAEYKAPYFKAVELLIGGTLDIYFVPVIAGEYDFLCTITGHAAAGMTGKISVTGGEGFKLDLEVASDFNMALVSDGRTSGSHAVWTNAQEPVVEMIENADGSLAFDPAALIFSRNSGYKLHLKNPAGNSSKHYFTAAGFYKTLVTRKAEDSQAEIKVPYLKAVEILIGGESTLFIVPTQSGSFDSICTIAGHEAAGMKGTVVVQ